MKKRYWLRGGIIFTIIYFIVGVLYVPGAIISSNLAFIPLDLVFNIGRFSGFEFISLGIYSGGYIGLVIALVVILVLYFAIGAFIGWLYGKIKNRNQDKTVIQ